MIDKELEDMTEVDWALVIEKLTDDCVCDILGIRHGIPESRCKASACRECITTAVLREMYEKP